MIIGRASAATRPAKPAPSGIRTPTSSSIPRAARATSSCVSGDHGAVPRRGPAREAAAGRHADALLDLLLDAERGARHELVRGLVEQENRARVDVEDVAGALEKGA